MRIARRTETTSPRPKACATIGTTAMEKPDPKMKIVKKNWPDRTMAASDCAPSCPTITTSVVWMPSCASCAPINGMPSASVARMCEAQLLA